MKFHGFHVNPLCDLKEWGCIYKNTHISIGTHPKLLNMIPNLFLDIEVLFGSLIYRGSYMGAHVLLNLLNELGKR